MRKSKIVLLPQSGQKRVIYSSYEVFNFVFGKYFSVKPKRYSTFAFPTHHKYIFKG